MRKTLGALLLGAALVWLASACGGGGGGGGPTTPTTPTPPPDPVNFTAMGTPGASTIHLGKADGTGDDLLRIEVRASGFDDLFALGFDLVYPADLLDYRAGSQTEGGFLSGDGSRTEILVRERQNGTIIVGLSRIGDVGGVEGSGLLLTLDFSVVNNGSGAFSFSANTAFDSGGNRLDDAVWQAGDLQVNR